MPETARTPSKTSQVAPAHSENHTPRRIDEPIAESKANLKPQALKSEQIFPTLEGLAEEKGIEVEHNEEKPKISPNDAKKQQAEAPAAWQGKLPEIVKKDAEFTQADTIIINEPVEEQQDKKDDVAKDSAVLLKSNASAEPAVRPKEAAHTASERKAPETKANKSVKAEPLPAEEPIAESKANLKPQALKSEQIFPTLEGLAEEKGLDTYIDDHNDENKASDEKQAAVSASEAPAAWQGKLPEVVKQDAEFTKADVKFVDEPAERAAAIAKYKQERKERRQALKTGPLRWFKGEPRETSLERLFVRGVSGVLGVGFSLVCGFLRIFGLRDLSGRLVMGCRNFVDNVIEGTFLRHLRSFGHQWWMYRLVVRVVRNIDRNVRARIEPEPGKDVEDKVNELHREAQTSLATAKREASRLRDEATEVLSEARERIRSNAAAKK